MNIFLTTLIVGFSLIIGVNMALSFTLNTALNLFLCFAVVMLPAAVFLFFGRLIFKSQIDGNINFKVGKFKKWLCKLTRVKKWKDHIPVGGRVAGFRLKSLDKNATKNVTYLNRFIFESCFAEWLHFIIFVWCFVSLFILPQELFLTMSLPIALLFAYQNIVSVIIQWETRPRIARLKESVEKYSNFEELQQNELTN
ncbi:MAG: hypothetical protein J5779_01255 [Clostridia bacterium]|nr:hypothetical protein [Clostridia bacterium]